MEEHELFIDTKTLAEIMGKPHTYVFRIAKYRYDQMRTGMQKVTKEGRKKANHMLLSTNAFTRMFPSRSLTDLMENPTRKLLYPDNTTFTDDTLVELELEPAPPPSEEIVKAAKRPPLVLPTRPAWHKHWMRMAHIASEMTTCMSGRKVGAVFIHDKRLLATGVNGVPAGTKHPDTCERREKGCKSGEDLHLCICAHAEANGIANAARHGIALKGSSVYCTTLPCAGCMGALANVGVSDVYYFERYKSPQTEAIAVSAGIQLFHFVGDLH